MTSYNHSSFPDTVPDFHAEPIIITDRSTVLRPRRVALSSLLLHCTEAIKK